MIADISSGKREMVLPRFLYAEEEEWQDKYPLEFFRKKIYQEIKFDKRQQYLKEKFGDNMEDEDGDDHGNEAT